MWLKLVLLCCLAVYASTDPLLGWKQNHEYNYLVRGRLLTGFNQISNKYSGILLRSKLTIRPTQEGHLMGKLSNTEYANVQKSLKDDWEQQIPDSELSYEELFSDSKLFKIVMRSGIIDDLVVDQTISNWEANVIKALVSQLQLDITGKNHMSSSINLLGQNSAVFKTMEHTVTGRTETLYEIHPFPEHVIQSQPHLAPLKNRNPSDNLIEVLKSKNFTHNTENPSYHFGFEGVDDFEADNDIGKFLSRTSVSRVILSGTLKDFTIQSAVTVEQVTVNANLQDQQRGLTGSIVNLTLDSMKEENQDFEEISRPVTVGLVYRFDQPFAKSNEPQRKSISSGSGLSTTPFETDDNASSESGNDPNLEVYLRVQDQPRMHEAPASPLLPFTTGYDGQAISLQQNIKQLVRNLAIKIGKEFQQPQSIPKQNTVGKFLSLTSVVRVMNEQEMKEVAKELYTQEKEGAAADAWIAYRDAVAQAGTGPALLLIEEAIRSDKITGHAAAETVATAADSVRQPTEQYMQFFFGMIKNAEIMGKKKVNESILLSYTSLVHKVYVNEKTSHHNYPVHSFGTFNRAQGRLLVEREVIPHLSSKLNKAIIDTDTQNIHLYIRALGNIGHQQILQTFKPYLEGTKKASQFQRILMVMALDNLVKSNPKVARSVLFKIYQNPRDFEQVRVAAVYQLMCTSPTPAMLQKMAMYTNVDTNNHVNSAVKSAIEEAATLQAPRHAHIRAAARSAQPLLTARDFGIQNPKLVLQNYVVEQMQLEVKQILASFGGEDGVFPKGFNYLLRGRFGGIKQHIVNAQSMVSSVQDLVNVWDQQTKEYRGLLREKQSHEGIKTKWSSEHTANLLRYQNEQREQLEGYMYLHVDAFQKVWSYTNNTVDELAEAIRYLEQELNQGRQDLYKKMSTYPQTAISFPTAWGLPFIYTLDRPILMRFKSKVTATSKPSFYSPEGIQKPETVDVNYEIQGFISGRTQGQFGFFTPFNHKRYSAGYDKNFQLSLPKVAGKMHIDVENKQTTLEVSDFEKDVNVLHFSTWPYVAQYDIADVQPKKEILLQDDLRKLNTHFGEDSTGIAFSFQMNSDRTIDYGFLYDQLQKNSLTSALLGSWLDNNIQHVEINVGIDKARTSTKKVLLHFGHQEHFSVKPKDLKDILERIVHNNPVAEKSWERQNKFLKNTTAGISNVNSQVIDTALVFDGQTKIQYIATASVSKSNIDPKGRVLVQVEKTSKDARIDKMIISAESLMPNPPTLNLESAMKFDPTISIKINGTLERSQKPKPTEFRLNVKLSKSEERKQYLQKQQQYKDCLSQMKEGNNQLPACETMTAEANLLDQFSVDGNYQNIDKALLNQVYKMYSILRHHWYPRISEDLVVGNRRSFKNHFDIDGNYSPDLSALNASLTTEYGSIEVNNLPVNDFARSIFVSHPGYDVQSRIAGHTLNYDAYHASCVVDKNAVNSLDNKTYPVSLSEDWVILFHYVPRRPSPIKGQPELNVTTQLNHHLDGYIVYVRAAGRDTSHKEIKMVIQSPSTLSKVIDITLKPSTSADGYARLFVQGEQIIYDDEGSHMYDDYMQVYKLPNGEVKVKVYNSFNIVFDGTRAKLLILNDKFRDGVRGLCGTFTGEPETDFTDPANCIMRNPEVFVARNSVPEKQRTKRMNDMLLIQSQEKKCYQKSVGYVQIVSAKDSGLTGGDKYGSRSGKITRRTKFINVDNKICFSVRPLEACPYGYTEYGVTRNVPAHCVEYTSHAKLWMAQIQKGANPSFEHKEVNQHVSLVIANKCVKW